MSRSPSAFELLTASFSKDEADALRLVLDAIPHPIFLKDEQSRFVLLNRSMCEFMGQPHEALVGKTDHDFIAKEYADVFRRVDRLVLETGDVNENEELIKAANGDVRTLITRKARVLMADGARFVVACISDVTELKQREETLQLLFDANPLPMWVFEKGSLTFLAVNDAAVEHYGYTRDEFLSMTALDIRPAADAEPFRAIAGTGRGTYLTGQSWRHLKADGKLIDVLVYSKPIDYHGRAAVIAAVADVTESKRREDDLRRTRAFLDTVIENVPVMLCAKEAETRRYVLMNRAGEDLLGIPRGELVGKTDADLFPREAAEAFADRDREALLSGRIQIAEGEKIPTRYKGVREGVTRRLAIESQDGKSRYVLAVTEDMTERKRDAERIAYLAAHDPVTGLPNRSALLERLEFTLERASSGRETFALLRVALDGLNEIEDVFGPAAADALIRLVAERIVETVGGNFLACTDRGEFSIVAGEGPHPDAAVALADRMLAAAAEPFEVNGRMLRVELSIGIAFFPDDAADVTLLLGHAQAALERAVADGRGVFRLFEADMDRKLRERRALGQELRSALDRGELFLHYQPQAKMSGDIIGFEALIRWTHKERGAVPPPEFVPAAEESGLIVPIGEWVLREACREAADWPKPLHIAVNLSPVQFRQGDLPGLVHGILLETGLAPGRLELEVTESVMLDDFSRVSSILRRLKALGVKIALDDFGTGYSSLSYLHTFPFDKIKIDKSFVWMLQKNPQSGAIIRAIAGIGRDLSMQVIAEGVETADQLKYLRDEGCHAVQGYLIGRPAPIAQYARLVGRPAPQSQAAR